MSKKLILPFMFSIIVSAAWAQDFDYQYEQKVKDLLQQFNKNPNEFMNRQLVKKEKDLPVIGKSKFLSSDLTDNRFVAAKTSSRQILSGRAGYDYSNQPWSLVDNPDNMMRSLDQIESYGTEGLLEAALPETPWSDDYWPIYRGILGARYTSPNLPDSENWLKHFNSVLDEALDLLSIWNSKQETEIDNLSPSEKYDLLVGDLSDLGQYDYFWSSEKWSRDTWPKGYLTPNQWLQGQRYYNDAKKVERWMGICHGWAPAAYSMPKPQRVIEVLAADGVTKIKFYPADIKALTSYLWAENGTRSKFVGGRCNEKNPKKDRATGRVLDDECFDVNPATWHLGVVHQIGVNKRSFVIDATYDYEVWNQPVQSYKYRYFDPVTEKTSKSWLKTRRELSDEEFAKKDKFSKFRFKTKDDGQIDENYYRRNPEKRPHWVVGVAMDVDYVVETVPDHNEREYPSFDLTKSVTYMYDLEINKDGEVIGGEWYTNLHPDFLWNAPLEAVEAKEYMTRYDSGAQSNWDGHSVLPADWQDMAKRAALEGKPLGKIIDSLIEASRSQR